MQNICGNIVVNISKLFCRQLFYPSLKVDDVTNNPVAAATDDVGARLNANSEELLSLGSQIDGSVTLTADDQTCSVVNNSSNSVNCAADISNVNSAPQPRTDANGTVVTERNNFDEDEEDINSLMG